MAGLAIQFRCRIARSIIGATTGALVLILQQLTTPTEAFAEDFRAVLDKTLKSHDRLLSLKSDVEAATNRSRVALGDWFPTFTPTANGGYEEQTKGASALNTSTTFYEVDLKLSQLLWDFGATNASIETARLKQAQKEVAYEAGVQLMILEAATAYSNLIRSYRNLEFARQSEDNIRKQTGLEQARIESGAGLSTDVLQSRRQLAGAEAKRIEEAGKLHRATNRFRAVFGWIPDDISALTPIEVDRGRLPNDLDETLKLSIERNLDISKAQMDETIAKEAANKTMGSKFYPSIKATTERKWKRNVAGTLDTKEETIAKVEMTLPFNLGLVAVNTLRADQADMVSKTKKVNEEKIKTEEKARNGWEKLNTAEATFRSRTEQWELAQAFLDLARKERKLGNRSLIDILSGETALNDAQSAALSAETDITLAVLNLLLVTAQLEPSIFGPPPEELFGVIDVTSPAPSNQ